MDEDGRIEKTRWVEEEGNDVKGGGREKVD
jgi:hypothetical protein